MEKERKREGEKIGRENKNKNKLIYSKSISIVLFEVGTIIFFPKNGYNFCFVFKVWKFLKKWIIINTASILTLL